MALPEGAPSAGALLREWRRRRNLSQLELALRSAVSARHLSFIETGRARPSREMVLHLAARLDVPLRDRNRLLLAAGFAPVFGERSLDESEMVPVREALERFLSVHEPYPAVVVNRHWDIVAANRGVAYVCYRELVAYPGVVTEDDRADAPTPNDIMLKHELRLADKDLALFCTFTTFGTARDLTLAELTIVAFYPANRETAEALAGAVSEAQPG
jgi:transcriptional regulator with XRE-family HTH domain